MPKPKRLSKKQSPQSFADVTINDHANSPTCKNRPKKWTANVERVVKNQVQDERSWDEKVDDYDGEFVEQVDDDGAVSYVIDKVEPRRRKKTVSTNSEGTCVVNGNAYHIDIWFLISEYIRPEDVGRFAAICKTSYEVVCTEKFWYNLYKRHYTNVPNLPERLQPNCLLRKYSLRTCVIRALHYMYQPFINTLRLAKNCRQHPDVLLRAQCISMWVHKDKSQQWTYYFKMKRVHYCKKDKRQPQNIFELLDDLTANQEEDCRILHVSCKQLIPVAPVLGLILTSAQLNLSSGLTSYKLQLWFGSEIQYSNPSSTGGNGATVIILDPVINVGVLDWWHPLYPHTNSMEHLFSQD